MFRALCERWLEWRYPCWPTGMLRWGFKSWFYVGLFFEKKLTLNVIFFFPKFSRKLFTVTWLPLTKYKNFTHYLQQKLMPPWFGWTWCVLFLLLFLYLASVCFFWLLMMAHVFPKVWRVLAWLRLHLNILDIIQIHILKCCRHVYQALRFK